MHAKESNWLDVGAANNRSWREIISMTDPNSLTPKKRFNDSPEI
jgi:hypothetical protein